MLFIAYFAYAATLIYFISLIYLFVAYFIAIIYFIYSTPTRARRDARWRFCRRERAFMPT
jgi:hypothetical protein